MLRVPVSPIKDKRAGRSAAASDKERKNENKVPGSGADCDVFDGSGNGRIRTRSDAGGEGASAAVSGNDKKECSRSDERVVGSTMELQAGTGPLVGGAGDGAHRGGGRFYPWHG